MNLSAKKNMTSILFGLMLFGNNFCIGQIDFQSSVYQDVSKINQKVHFGKFGCHYKISHKIGSDRRIKESRIKIPNKGNLKIKFEYNEHGDVTYEEISSNSRKVTVKNHYVYEIIRPKHNNLTLYRIKKQTTKIDNQKPIEISSIKGGNTYEILKEQLINLKKKKDQAISGLLGEYPKTKKYKLPACNCKNSFETNLIDQIYDCQLLRLNDKNGISIGPGRRNGVLYYIGDSKRKKWRLQKVLFDYNRSTVLVENYKYKK